MSTRFSEKVLVPAGLWPGLASKTFRKAVVKTWILTAPGAVRDAWMKSGPEPSAGLG